MTQNRNKIPYKGQTCLYFPEFGKPSRRCFRNVEDKRFNKAKRDKQFAPVRSLLDELYALASANRHVPEIRELANRMSREINTLETTL